MHLIPSPDSWPRHCACCRSHCSAGSAKGDRARARHVPRRRLDDDFTGRRIGVEVTDLGLRWIVAFGERRVDVLERSADAEAIVRGTATDLLLLASRLEDADTLFFHRRLELTGDVELGLAVRNLLDQLPWDSLPLGLRIALNRGARLARAARDAYHSTAA
ncbi:MAG: SCP2 sterol-binding domain-containing protein [Proteobacteria bacterium]|nr:SCP2 sterol-binding domain-containing protein [Pseudomonadota bacterium]